MVMDLSNFRGFSVEPSAKAEAEGKPLELPLDVIEQDPNQPRAEFDEASLQEIANSISVQGVLQPVIVRTHPTALGRYMLRYGARRLLGSRRAGKQTIPAIVNDSPELDDFAQVVENEQREALSPLDLANFIKRKLDQGLSQGEIARRLGKTRPVVTYHTAFIDAPEFIMTAYRQERLRGATEAAMLRRLHAEHGDAVERWCESALDITRGALMALKESLEQQAGKPLTTATEARAAGELPSSPVAQAQGGKPLTGGATVACVEMAPEQSLVMPARSGLGQAANASGQKQASGAPSVQRRFKAAGRPVVIVAESAGTVIRFAPDGLPQERWRDIEKALKKLLD
jgi:ParB family chromosome partitioning protein